MKVGSTVSDPSKRRRVESLSLALFLFCCMISSGVSYAQEASETAPPPAQTAATTDNVTAETPAVTQEPAKEEPTKLEKTLKKNKKCLNCHKRDKTKQLEDGNEMSLQVHREDYLASAHGEVSCTGCHRAIGKRKHPSKSTNISIRSEWDYSVEINDNCKRCHRKKFTQYENSVHAVLVEQGSKEAPLCTSCHSAHAVETMADYRAESGFPCKNCHENIFNAYSESVHGQARIDGNTIRDTHIQSPICSDCHESHQITALAIGDVLRTTCIGCHENIILLHTQWLPNAGTHLDIVSCAVCHAPFARQKFDLHLYDDTTNVPVAQVEGEESIQEQLQAIVAEGGDQDPLEVWKARGGFGQTGEPSNISLRSRMEVMSGVAAHQIANKSFAVRTCDSCHESNTRQRKSITVSITQPDGRKQSFETDRSILSSVGAVNSISDFYALGGNTNKYLDYFLLLAFLGAIGGVAGHYTVGKIIEREKKKERNHVDG